MKNGILFHKDDRDRERLAWDKAVPQERAMVKETLLLDHKVQFNQTTKLRQCQSSAQSTDSRVLSEFLEQVEKLKD